jgi:hypothetical protein
VISSLPPAIPGRNYKGKSVTSKVMIYGINKNIIAEPYFDLLNVFKNRLSKIKKCLVIGYSFRDPWITQIFLDIIKKYPNEIEIEYIGKKTHTQISDIPKLNKIMVPIAETLEKYLELPKKEEDKKI